MFFQKAFGEGFSVRVHFRRFWTQRYGTACFKIFPSKNEIWGRHKP
jgi:hypothetical protein